MDCKLRAKNCGGCPMLATEYAAQLKKKEADVRALLVKYGPVSPIRGMETPYHYRNKVISTFAPAACWKTHLRHLRGPHPQGAAGGKLPFAGRGTGQGDAGRPRRRQRLPLPALQRGQRHRPAPPLPAPPGRRHRSGDGGAGHGPARAARREELRESPAGRGRKAGRPRHHRRTELQSPPHQRRSGRGRKKSSTARASSSTPSAARPTPSAPAASIR